MKSRILSILLLGMIPAMPSQGQEILFPAMENSLWGYVDLKGEWAIEPTYSLALEFSEGLGAVQKNDDWGYIDKTGTWKIRAQFQKAAPFSEGLAAVVLGNRWGFIDHKGQLVIEPLFHKASSFSEGLAVVSSGHEYFYISRKGKRIGSRTLKRAMPFAEGLASIVSDTETGYIDNHGNLRIKHDFRSAAPFSEGRAQVQGKNGWGFINRKGEIVIPANFKGCSQFSDGLAAVREKNKWGFINKQGQWVIKAGYEEAEPFIDGYAVVKSKGKYGVIDKHSSWVIRPKFEKMGNAGRSASVKSELLKSIRLSFNNWTMKGEFEKTEDYKVRMNSENQRRVLDSIAQIVINEYGNKTLDIEKAELGYYNADLEEFNIYIPGTVPSRLHVPITEALWFKSNWHRGLFSERQFMLAGESLVLSHFIFTLDGTIYSHILQEQDTYLYDYAAISLEDDILVPEIYWKAGLPDEGLKALPGTSDVDIDIPVTRNINKNTFALIIGNEDYRSFQSGLDEEIDVSYASIDAEIFSKYASSTLGIPKENIVLIKNGTAGQIQQALAKMNSISEAFHGKAELIFYYAGHGLPDEESGKSYLIPVDISGSDLAFAISLDDALNTLAEHDNRRVTVFLDACFTGGGRAEGLIASRGIKIKPKSPFVKGNLVLFAASSGSQSAFAYKEKGHGMFTYYLLKKLKETNGQVRYSELDRYLKESVGKSAIIYNNKEQTPDLIVSPSLKDSWEDFRLDRPYVNPPRPGSSKP